MADPVVVVAGTVSCDALRLADARAVDNIKPPTAARAMSVRIILSSSDDLWQGIRA
jgi:hypothetical protein